MIIVATLIFVIPTVPRRKRHGAMTTGEYPECEKLAAIHDERRAITEFIEWAGHRIGSERLDELIMEFYDIDPDKLETERREMLEAYG